ncbi:MAG: indole-3-glycerol phosphate synthase TrpC [Rhodospirillales bacterium]|jgi:indole-3-glycerol phosphate synthase|nr:indole-3-glycerol-phosphate synthase [Rhodospirillaceae bacterium]MDP6430636.1 indole-3-glycerol phosphate synthase TrpC [Rhodospirillales bacterium]MDP6645651.1 indole-3-glycerol phosphate synthase TrpC [Rhodospirillales bacterium]MDP6843301.1 indole-3-glycerol phosphate synthase TrpC [Rhodospirillales bacterium]
MSDVLVRICDQKRQHVAARKAEKSEQNQLDMARQAPPPRGFADALERSVADGRFGLIAEIKKASPSHGLIRADFDPAGLARAYRNGGASCLSVLTDTPFFEGEDGHLAAARAAVPLPALRKDFMVDPYQIAEARAIGADCVLIIMAALDDALAAEMKALAEELGMDVLIEVHDEAETERALRLGPRLLGINNRNLKTLNTDLATTERLARMAIDGAGDGVTLVSESGLSQPADLQRMAAAGANCFLVGEALMRNRDVEAATRALLGLDAGIEKKAVSL